jgi:hypothetical protein
MSKGKALMGYSGIETDSFILSFLPFSELLILIFSLFLSSFSPAISYFIISSLSLFPSVADPFG